MAEPIRLRDNARPRLGVGATVVLPKGGAQLFELALAGPDQALMGPGQHLDRLGQVAVAGDGPVKVAVGAGQLGQHRGVARIGLGP